METKKISEKEKYDELNAISKQLIAVCERLGELCDDDDVPLIGARVDVLNASCRIELFLVRMIRTVHFGGKEGADNGETKNDDPVL